LNNWDEIRTALHVAKVGTVSGAAEALGVHHATVIRHIDALEAQLGSKLFQRHARGYTATEAGQDLLRVAQATDDQFSQLAGRIKGQGEEVRGDLVVTAVPGLGGLLMPALTGFEAKHPGVVMRYLTGFRLFRLEYGEAHVAIRAGSAPEEPDNVAQPFYPLRFAIYANEDYLDKYGQPESDEALKSHRFVGPDDEDSRAPFHRWMKTHIPRENVVFRMGDTDAVAGTLLAGAGIGFLPVWVADNIPDLVQVMPPRPEWTTSTWLVTHVDLHRTPKVQAMLTHLKEVMKSWPGAEG
jgi:DNA-binding transcriptional LysR family regulator